MLEPRQYQYEGIEFLSAHPRCILGDDMGTGKTMQSVLACEKAGTQRVLVVCPHTATYMWRNEILKWVPEARIQVIDGTTAERIVQLRRIVTYYIIGYEAARIHEARLIGHWDAVIIDEAHRVKNRKAKSTVSIRNIVGSAKYVFEMTGTPIINRASELFSLLQILFPKRFTSYWSFVHKYCEVFNNGWGWQVKDIMDPNDYRVKELQGILKSVMLRRTKAEVLPELPAKTIQQISITLTDDHRKLYDKMRHDMIVELQERTIAVPTVIALVTRLRQMAIDPTLMLEGDSTPLEGAKVDALHDILDGAGDQKVVVFSQFAKVIHRLQHNLNTWGISFTGFTGETPALQREIALGDFRQDPKVRVFLVTIGAGGQSISLASASIAVFMDKAWAPAYNNQAQDRLHRMPQEHSVTIYELIARKTVEESIESKLAHKDNLTDLMIEQLKHLVIDEP